MYPWKVAPSVTWSRLSSLAGGVVAGSPRGGTAAATMGRAGGNGASRRERSIILCDDPAGGGEALGLKQIVEKSWWLNGLLVGC